MKELLNQNIKDIIETHPAVGAALEEYKIACTTCNVGTCLLKDIIEIHSLSESNEMSLFKKIAEIVYPGQDVEIPRLPRKAVASQGSFSPPIQLLVKEHTHIMKVITAIPRVIESLETTLVDKKETIRKAVDFIRNYADKFHHAKEEDLLFKQFDESTEVIVAMLKEHEIGRNHVREIVNGLDTNDAVKVAENLRQYAELLTEHIRKEDEILYPWIDRNLSDSQIGKIYSRSLEISNDFGELAAEYETFADSVIKSYA